MNETAIEVAPHGAQNGIARAPETALSPVMSTQQAVAQHKQIMEIMRGAMTEGHDYGTVPGTRGKSLFKAGAERLCAIFGLAVHVAHIGREFDNAAGFLEYTVTVELVSRHTGVIVAQGIGLCNSHEKKYRNQDAANIANTLLKMAKKRALVDATLAATGASGIFDATDEEEIETRPGPARQAPQPRQQRADGAELPAMTHEQRARIEELAPLLYADGIVAVVRGSGGLPLPLWGQARAVAVLERLETQYVARQEIQVMPPAGDAYEEDLREAELVEA